MGRVYSLPEEYQFTPTQPRCCSDVDRNTVSYGLVHRRTAQGNRRLGSTASKQTLVRLLFVDPNLVVCTVLVLLSVYLS